VLFWKQKGARTLKVPSAPSLDADGVEGVGN